MIKEDLAALRKRSFLVVHLIFLISIVETIVLATDPAGFCAISGVPLFVNARHPKGVEALLILWVIGTALAVAIARKRIYPYSEEQGGCLWNEPLLDGGEKWFYIIVLPQLLMGLYLDLYIYLVRSSNLLGLVMFAVKILCAGYGACAVHRAK